MCHNSKSETVYSTVQYKENLSYVLWYQFVGEFCVIDERVDEVKEGFLVMWFTSGGAKLHVVSSTRVPYV